MTRPAPTTTEHGVLGVPGATFDLERVPAADDLAGLVERYWLAHADRSYRSASRSVRAWQ